MPHFIVAGYRSVKDIHAFQHVIIEMFQLRVLESAPPVVGHPLIVGPDGVQPV